jgi:hypothetical protein
MKAKLLESAFFLFFGFGTFQWVTPDSIMKKILSCIPGRSAPRGASNPVNSKRIALVSVFSKEKPRVKTPSETAAVDPKPKVSVSGHRSAVRK